MKPDNILVIRNDLPTSQTYMMNIAGVPTNITIPSDGEREFEIPSGTKQKLQELGVRGVLEAQHYAPEILEAILHLEFNLKEPSTDSFK